MAGHDWTSSGEWASEEKVEIQENSGAVKRSDLSQLKGFIFLANKRVLLFYFARSKQEWASGGESPHSGQHYYHLRADARKW